AAHDGARASQRLQRAHAHPSHRVRHSLLLRSAVERLRKGSGKARGRCAMTEAAAFRVIRARARRKRHPLRRWYRGNERAILSAAGIVSFIAAWQVGSDAGLISKFFFNALPRVALLPLVVLWVGLGFEMKTIIVFFGGFFSIILPTVEGVRTVDRQLLDVARSFRAPERLIFTSLVIPGTLPFIVSG